MRVPKLILVLVAIVIAGPALAGPAANVIDVAPPAEPGAVIARFQR